MHMISADSSIFSQTNALQSMPFQRQVGCIKGLCSPGGFNCFSFFPWKFGHIPCFGTQLRQPTSYTPPKNNMEFKKMTTSQMICMICLFISGGVTRFQPLFFRGLQKQGATFFLTNIITYLFCIHIFIFSCSLLGCTQGWCNFAQDVPPQTKMDNVCWGHGCAPAETMDLPPEMLGVETPLVPGDVSLAAWISEVWRNHLLHKSETKKKSVVKIHCCFLLQMIYFH